MMKFFKVLSTSASGMQAQADRMRVISENVANADTPGYRRKLVSFGAEYDRQAELNRVVVDRMTLDQSNFREVYDPSHPLADETGRVELSNVNLITEIADAREARRTYEANLNIFDQTRRMYSGLRDLLDRR